MRKVFFDCFFRIWMSEYPLPPFFGYFYDLIGFCSGLFYSVNCWIIDFFFSMYSGKYYFFRILSVRRLTSILRAWICSQSSSSCSRARSTSWGFIWEVFARSRSYLTISSESLVDFAWSSGECEDARDSRRNILLIWRGSEWAGSEIHSWFMLCEVLFFEEIQSFFDGEFLSHVCFDVSRESTIFVFEFFHRKKGYLISSLSL